MPYPIRFALMVGAAMVLIAIAGALAIFAQNAPKIESPFAESNICALYRELFVTSSQKVAYLRALRLSHNDIQYQMDSQLELLTEKMNQITFLSLIEHHECDPPLDPGNGRLYSKQAGECVKAREEKANNPNVPLYAQKFERLCDISKWKPSLDLNLLFK